MVQGGFCAFVGPRRVRAQQSLALILSDAAMGQCFFVRAKAVIFWAINSDIRKGMVSVRG